MRATVNREDPRGKTSFHADSGGQVEDKLNQVLTNCSYYCRIKYVSYHLEPNNNNKTIGTRGEISASSIFKRPNLKVALECRPLTIRSEASPYVLALLLVIVYQVCFIGALPIAPPTREPSLARLGSTTIDDEELSRTMDRSGPGQEDDDPVSPIEFARTMELVQADESSRSEVSERPESGAKNETVQQPSLSQINNIIGHQSTSQHHINNQSSTMMQEENLKTPKIQHDSQETSAPIQQVTHARSSNSHQSNDISRELISEEPSNETLIPKTPASISRSNVDFGHHKREERRRKTAGPNVQISGSKTAMSSIKSVITRSKRPESEQATEQEQKLINEANQGAIRLSTMNIATSHYGQSRPDHSMNNHDSERPSIEGLHRSSTTSLTPGQESSLDKNGAFDNKQSSPNNNPTGSPIEIRAFESSAVETSVKNPANETQDQRDHEEEGASGQDDDSTPTSELLPSSTTMEPPNENENSPPVRTHQGQNSKFSLNHLSLADKSISRPIKLHQSNQSKLSATGRAQLKTGQVVESKSQHELLVGPFKSESEAPDTITLAGVVYQKSGTSSSMNPPSLNDNGLAQSSSHHQMSASSTTTSSRFGPLNKAASKLQQQQQLHMKDDSKTHSENLKKPTGKLAHINNNIIGSASDQHHLGFSKFGTPNSQQQRDNWSPQALASGTQLLLPISQAQLITLLGQQQSNGILMNSASHTSSLGAPQNKAKTKEKSNVSVTFTTIPSPTSAESLLASLASGLDVKLAQSQSQAASSSLSSPLSIQSLADSDWPSMAASSSTSSSSTSGALDNLVGKHTNAENYYLKLLEGASGSDLKQLESIALATNSNPKDSKNSNPVVIVEKNVKPMKYHFLKAYLKLRRLLKPAEATYVFPVSNLKRGQMMNHVRTHG